MLASDEFKRLLTAYIREKIVAASADYRQFRRDGERDHVDLARFWGGFYEARINDFTDTYQENLLGAFKDLQERGLIEIIASAATHAYLPLLDTDSSVRAQIKQGVKTYRRYFVREPWGIWLPECGYRPSAIRRDRPADRREGIESILADVGLRYFFLDGHHLNGGSPEGFAREVSEYHAAVRRDDRRDQAGGSEERLKKDRQTPGVYEAVCGEILSRGQGDVYRIYRTGRPETGECAFLARDRETSCQVWNSKHGYPGDPWYLEFHKKRTPGGLRYWRITDSGGDLGGKLSYDPVRASERVREHAHHFTSLVKARLREYRTATGRAGVMTLPFDAELFGHWWFEGVDWLYEVVSAFDENCDTMISQASRVLSEIPPTDSVQVQDGSWGQGGGHRTWYNKETAWIWQCIHQAERRMLEAVKSERDEFSGRILRQMARELFLVQSSDWPFLVTTGTAGDYGRLRFSGHCDAFEELDRMITGYAVEGTLEDDDIALLAAFEKRDAVFQDIDLEWFRLKQP
jgi:1,4-alpha-glucan branching enzyme